MGQESCDPFDEPGPRDHEEVAAARQYRENGKEAFFPLDLDGPDFIHDDDSIPTGKRFAKALQGSRDPVGRE